MDMAVVFYLLLFLVAFLYASVGHGGANGYRLNITGREQLIY